MEGELVRPLCFLQYSIETRDHLFFSCGYVSEIWAALAKSLLNNHFTTDWTQILTHVSTQQLDRVSRFLVRYVFQATIFAIWRERNGRRHVENPNTPTHLIRWIDKQVRNQLTTIRQMGDHRYETGFQLWFQARA